jgi:hypothetical protein
LSTDDLSTPLGQGKAGRQRFKLSFNAVHVLAAALTAVLLAFVGFAIFNDNPLGGEPMARVMLEPAGAPDTAAKTPAMARPRPPSSPPSASRRLSPASSAP